MSDTAHDESALKKNSMRQNYGVENFVIDSFANMRHA